MKLGSIIWAPAQTFHVLSLLLDLITNAKAATDVHLPTSTWCLVLKFVAMHLVSADSVLKHRGIFTIGAIDSVINFLYRV